MRHAGSEESEPMPSPPEANNRGRYMWVRRSVLTMQCLNAPGSESPCATEHHPAEDCSEGPSTEGGQVIRRTTPTTCETVLVHRRA